MFHNAQLAQVPAILDNFINTTSTDKGVIWGVVGNLEVVSYSQAQQFSMWNGIGYGPIALQIYKI